MLGCTILTQDAHVSSARLSPVELLAVFEAFWRLARVLGIVVGRIPTERIWFLFYPGIQPRLGRVGLGLALVWSPSTFTECCAHLRKWRETWKQGARQPCRMQFRNKHTRHSTPAWTIQLILRTVFGGKTQFIKRLRKLRMQLWKGLERSIRTTRCTFDAHSMLCHWIIEDLM